MTGRLNGKRVVLVGAGQSPGATMGIGRATALLFAKEGARLLLVDRDLAGAADTVSMMEPGGGDVSVLQGDITRAGDCEELAQAARSRLGGVDVLFNSVGILGPGLAADVAEDVWDTVIETNLKAMWLVAKHVLPIMVEQQGGSFVAVSSIGAERGGTSTVYGVSKAGVSRLVKSIASTYGQHNIRANAILPGLIDTPMAIDAAVAGTDMSRDELARDWEARVPMAYKGSAADVAYAALFFASDESRYVSGACLPVDGAVMAAR